MSIFQYEDEEKAEDFKITTFVNILKDYQKIGVPYSNSCMYDKLLLIDSIHYSPFSGLSDFQGSTNKHSHFVIY